VSAVSPSSDRFTESTCSHDAGGIALGIGGSIDRAAPAMATIAWPGEDPRRMSGLWRQREHQGFAAVLSKFREVAAAVDVTFGWPKHVVDMLIIHGSEPLPRDLARGSSPAARPLEPTRDTAVSGGFTGSSR
jgi:hypothetical protein